MKDSACVLLERGYLQDTVLESLELSLAFGQHLLALMSQDKVLEDTHKLQGKKWKSKEVIFLRITETYLGAQQKMALGHDWKFKKRKKKYKPHVQTWRYFSLLECLRRT
jgi:hypothetical protein